MEHLPEHMWMNILCRLPIKTLFQCRRVCKSWYDMLSEPYMAKLYATHAPTGLILFLRNDIIENKPLDLCMVDVDQPLHVTKKARTISNYEESTVTDTFLGNSCNGFVCICDFWSGDPIYLWNPIMDESVKLPEIVNKHWNFKVVCGLGFSSRTNKYKVVRVFHPFDPIIKNQWKVEVYTLGTHSWRQVGDCPYAMNCESYSGVYLNGNLHWFISDQMHSSELISCFDLEKEKFRCVPSPPTFTSGFTNRSYYCSNIGVLKDCLCVYATDAIKFNPDIEVWVMKNYGVKESWTKELSIRNPMVEWWNPQRWVQVIKILDNGIVLFLCGHTDLLVYNSRNREYFRTINQSKSETIAFVPSFVSLQDYFLPRNPTSR